MDKDTPLAMFFLNWWSLLRLILTNLTGAGTFAYNSIDRSDMEKQQTENAGLQKKMQNVGLTQRVTSGNHGLVTFLDSHRRDKVPSSHGSYVQ